MIESGRVDGLVLSDTNIDDGRIRYLLDQGFPFVAFGRANQEWRVSWVDVDGTSGSCQAVTHLLELGHRRIACLAWPAGSLTGNYRLEGYTQAMAGAGLAIDPDWLVRIENSYRDAYRATQHLLSLPSERRPTAVFAFSDLMAMGAMNAAADSGLAVGRDLAVVGFDDAPVAGFLRPPLTTIQQPVSAVGDRLVSILIDLIHNRVASPVQELFQPRLVVRESTAQSARS
jgi:DNA-binding LacI/PurR family transcriptional regulator